MTCAIGYASEYIDDCDISKFGEGCETCVPLFKSNFMIPIIVVAACTLILFIIIKYMEKDLECQNKK